jgi:hypothetical protein
MALNLGILGRIGFHVGLGSGRGDNNTQQKYDYSYDKQYGDKDYDKQQKSDEQDRNHYGYKADDHRGEGGWQDQSNSKRSQYGDNDHDWQNNGKNVSNDCDQQGDNHGPLPCELHHTSTDYLKDDCNTWGNDEGDLHAVLAALPDTGAMLDAAISHLDACTLDEIGCVDLTPWDDAGGSTDIG